MEKYDDSGIRKACPKCKRDAVRGLKFQGESSEEQIKCPHCGVALEKKVKVYKKIVVTLVQISIISFFILATIKIGNVVADRITCKSFKYKEDGQSIFDSDPIKYKYLDRNNDKKACQTLPSKYKKNNIWKNQHLS